MDLVVRSPARAAGLISERLRRIATPPVDAQLAPCESRVWWVERVGVRDYLRAVGLASPTVAEAGPERVVWDAVDGFEVFSRPGRPARARALDVTSLCPAKAVENVSVEAVEGETVRAFEAAALHAVRRVASVRLAAAEMRPALRRMNPPSGFAESLEAVRRAFVADDLVAPVGEDPYAFAAQLLLGDSAASAAPFHILQSDEIRDAWPLPGTAPDEDARTPRHQELLRRLVRECDRLGYQTTCNGHVDVRVAVAGCQILFEVKTAEDVSFVSQLRLAVGQLLDYRRSYAAYASVTKLCVVIEDVASYRAWARAFLADIGFGAVLASNSLDGLPGVLAGLGARGSA